MYLSRKYPQILKAVLLTAIIVGFVTMVFYRPISSKFSRLMRVLFGSEQQAPPEWIVYDTDPRNDAFIKGRLDIGQLHRLDRVLQKEKQNDGLRLDVLTLHEVAKNDNDIIDAYDRWRKCKDMRRSYHNTIYPDERQLYHYLKN